MSASPLDVLVTAARSVAAMVLDPSQRVFWGFLVSALVIAAVVHRRARGVPRPHRLWLHRSALLDYQLVAANALVRTLLAATWTVSSFGLAVWTVGRLDATFGATTPGSLEPVVITLLYTAVLFLAWDLSRYLLHRLMHTVPMLWELHKVHHSAEVLTPLTLYRVHPVESTLYALRGIVVTGLVTGMFFYLFRGRAIELELLGVNALGFVLNLAGGNLRHSHVWWTWGPRVERWLISPAQHQLHHAADEHRATNLGTWLACWDRLAGTLRTGDAGAPPRFGLPVAESNHHPHRLGSALMRPLAAAVGQLLPAGDPAEPTAETTRTVEA